MTIYRDTHSFTGQKKSSSKKEKKDVFITEYNFTKKTQSTSHNEACVIGALVSGYC
jgi:hypothetical protein